MSNNHYHAIRSKDGYQVIPVSKEAVYLTGSYLKSEKTFRLFHPETQDDFQFIPKMDEMGQPVTRKVDGKPQPTYDRKQIRRNFYFDLEGENIDWFLLNYVDNAKEVKIWMTEVVPDLTPEQP